MQLFYSRRRDAQHWVLSDEEAHHCAKVLRHQAGDELEVMDGQGNWIKGKIVRMTKYEIFLEVLSFRQQDYQPERRVHLAFAPVKNMSRLEWMMEKAVEVGVSDFWLVQTQRTEKTQVRLDRLQKVILAAAKQSLKCLLPPIHPLQSLESMVKATQNISCRLFGSMQAERALTQIYTGDEGIFLVGPEGDFTDAEVHFLEEGGFVGVHLGPHRLRTETAILTAGILMTQYLKK